MTKITKQQADAILARYPDPEQQKELMKRIKAANGFGNLSTKGINERSKGLQQAYVDYRFYRERILNIPTEVKAEINQLIKNSEFNYNIGWEHRNEERVRVMHVDALIDKKLAEYKVPKSAYITHSFYH